jgi:hypothetical protein
MFDSSLSFPSLPPLPVMWFTKKQGSPPIPPPSRNGVHWISHVWDLLLLDRPSTSVLLLCEMKGTIHTR